VIVARSGGARLEESVAGAPNTTRVGMQLIQRAQFVEFAC
jgi:hypothetical protein